MRNKQYQENEKRKIQEIQTNFLQRMMRTKTGKVVEGFMKWKEMPERKNTEAYKKASRFKDGLSKFV